MRRRSGALYSDSEEKYLNIAIKCQKSDNLFSSQFEEEEDIEMPESRSQSSELNSFDYNYGDSPSNFNSYTSQNKELNIYDDQKKFIGYNNSIANSNNTSFLNRSFEKEETSTKLARVMVIGEILAGKKTFVNSMFMVKSNKKNAILKNSTGQNSCLDLIVHSLTTKENEKIIYKFWIQNLSNVKFDNIIKVYYKSIDLFVLVFDPEKSESLEKLQTTFENIQSMLSDRSYNTILVAMHKKKKEIDHSKDIKFGKGNKIKEFFQVSREDKSNISILAKISEIILPGVKVKECKFK